MQYPHWVVQIAGSSRMAYHKGAQAWGSGSFCVNKTHTPSHSTLLCIVVAQLKLHWASFLWGKKFWCLRAGEDSTWCQWKCGKGLAKHDHWWNFLEVPRHSGPVICICTTVTKKSGVVIVWYELGQTPVCHGRIELERVHFVWFSSSNQLSNLSLIY